MGTPLENVKDVVFWSLFIFLGLYFLISVDIITPLADFVRRIPRALIVALTIGVAAFIYGLFGEI